MPSTIFSGNDVKTLKNNLSLNDLVKVIPNNGNPASGSGTAAPVGSIALDYTNGKTYKKTGSLNTEWAEIGSGVGGINYIVNPDAESGTAGWSTYADAAGAQPVDGTGGTPNVTWSRSTTTPLRGTGDFNFVKDAVNRQGQGVSYDVTVDNADLTRVLTVSFDYEVVSGTYSTGDLTVYLIQDPTGTPVVIQPAGYQVVSATAGTKMTQIATFQTDSAQKSYRLCFHVATTSASAYTLALDNIVLGPTQKVYGAPVTDWQSYTPSITATVSPNLGTSPTQLGKWRRVGDTMQVQIEIVVGSSGSNAGTGTYYFTLPSGFSVDISKIVSPVVSGAGVSTPLGQGWKADAAGAAPVELFVDTDSSIGLALSDWSAVQVSSTNYAVTASRRYSFFAQVPILGWSSNVEVSSSTDTRVVAASYVNSGGKSIPHNTQTTIDTNWTKLTDTHNAFSNGVFTCPVAGNYVVGARFFLNSAANTANSLFNITAIQAGSATTTINIGTYTALAASTYFVGTSGAGQVFSCQAGDTLTIQCYQTLTAGGRTLHTDVAYNSVSISRLSGPSVIAASETVSARYNNTSGQSGLTNNAYTTITGWTKTFDTHGFFNLSTGIATIPVSGKYLVQGQFLLTSASTTLNTEADLAIQQAGSASGTYLIGSTFPSVTGTYGVSGQGSNIIQCIAGDTLTVQIYQNTGISRALNTNGNYTWVSFTRIGN